MLIPSKDNEIKSTELNNSFKYNLNQNHIK